MSIENLLENLRDNRQAIKEEYLEKYDSLFKEPYKRQYFEELGKLEYDDKTIIVKDPYNVYSDNLEKLEVLSNIISDNDDVDYFLMQIVKLDNSKHDVPFKGIDNFFIDIPENFIAETYFLHFSEEDNALGVIKDLPENLPAPISGSYAPLRSVTLVDYDDQDNIESYPGATTADSFIILVVFRETPTETVLHNCLTLYNEEQADLSRNIFGD